ncbi:hypothetical protein B0H14DRAFT_3519241 [Mycena olivaceomarginata]|nr:hypothetical protein B0H14DRAFT_3519241 [Mycena olivaceomarginata]
MEIPSEAWKWAVGDVKWVLKKMVNGSRPALINGAPAPVDPAPDPIDPLAATVQGAVGGPAPEASNLGSSQANGGGAARYEGQGTPRCRVAVHLRPKPTGQVIPPFPPSTLRGGGTQDPKNGPPSHWSCRRAPQQLQGRRAFGPQKMGQAILPSPPSFAPRDPKNTPPSSLAMPTRTAARAQQRAHRALGPKKTGRDILPFPPSSAPRPPLPCSNVGVGRHEGARRDVAEARQHAWSSGAHLGPKNTGRALSSFPGSSALRPPPPCSNVGVGQHEGARRDVGRCGEALLCYALRPIPSPLLLPPCLPSSALRWTGRPAIRNVRPADVG